MPRTRQQQLSKRGKLLQNLNAAYNSVVLQVLKAIADVSSLDSDHVGELDSESEESEEATDIGMHSESSADSPAATARAMEMTNAQLRLLAAISLQYDKLKNIILNTRVLSRNPHAPRISQLGLLFWYHEHNPKKFTTYVRVQPSTFDSILDKIQDHPIYHNNSHNPQMPVQHQLAIYLYRIGHYGNSIGVDLIADWAGVSVGTVYNCTKRTTIAVLSLHDTAVHWPNTSQKHASQAYVSSQTCPDWKRGFLAADGTPIPLYQRPNFYGDVWFNKNRDYAVGLQVVIIIHSLYIVDYSAGDTGSVHDSVAFSHTNTFKNHTTLLQSNEWIWGDSAYGVAPWLIPPFKRPVHGDLTEEQHHFNYFLSRVRVRVEHAIGLLKGRFQSLRELRILIQGEDEHLWAIIWIRCCIILHNLILIIEGEGDQEYRDDLIELGRKGLQLNSDLSSDSEQEEDASGLFKASEHGGLNEGQVRREELMAKLFAFQEAFEH